MRQKELVRELQHQTNKITDPKFKTQLGSSNNRQMYSHIYFFFYPLVEISFLKQLLDFTHDFSLCLNCTVKKKIGSGVAVNRKIQAQPSSLLMAKAKV